VAGQRFSLEVVLSVMHNIPRLTSDRKQVQRLFSHLGSNRPGQAVTPFDALIYLAGKFPALAAIEPPAANANAQELADWLGAVQKKHGAFMTIHPIGG